MLLFFMVLTHWTLFDDENSHILINLINVPAGLLLCHIWMTINGVFISISLVAINHLNELIYQYKNICNNKHVSVQLKRCVFKYSCIKRYS